MVWVSVCFCAAVGILCLEIHSSTRGLLSLRKREMHTICVDYYLLQSPPRNFRFALIDGWTVIFVCNLLSLLSPLKKMLFSPLTLPSCFNHFFLLLITGETVDKQYPTVSGAIAEVHSYDGTSGRFLYSSYLPCLWLSLSCSWCGYPLICGAWSGISLQIFYTSAVSSIHEKWKWK